MFVIVGLWLFFANWIVTFASDPAWRRGEKFSFVEHYLLQKDLSPYKKWTFRAVTALCFLSILYAIPFRFFPSVRNTVFTKVLFRVDGLVMVAISMIEKVRTDYDNFIHATRKGLRRFYLSVLIFWVVIFLAVLAFMFIVADLIPYV